jgi:hypothetical protein
MAGKAGRSGGHNRKPNEQKRRLGNPGQKGLPDEAEIVMLEGYVPDPTDLPEPPRPLGRHGLEAWETALSAARHWLAPSDVQALLLWCEAIDDYVRFRAMAHNNPDDLAYTRRLTELRQQVAVLASELGLTPISRSRMAVAEVKVQEGLSRLIEPPTLTTKSM